MRLKFNHIFSIAVATAAIVTLLCSLTSEPTKNHGDLDVVLLGDSNTWIGGDDCSKENGWPRWFIERFEPASCRSYARSGATWTNTRNTTRDLRAYTEVLNDNNVIYNQIERLIEAVDKKEQPLPELIIIGAGANDAWFTARRPGVFDTTPAQAFADMDKLITDRKGAQVLSLAESVRYGCELLMQRFPDAQIVLLTPPQITQCSYENLRRAADIIEECGKRLSLTVIPLDAACGTYRPMEKTYPTNTYDGAHTSVKGAKRTGHLIAERIKASLLL